MADFNASTWSEIPSDNDATAPDGFPTGQNPNTLPDSLRVLAAAGKNHFDNYNAMYATTGTATALVLTRVAAPTEGYQKGLRFTFFPNATNAGAMTLNINSLGAKSILRSDGSALVAGDVTSGLLTEVYYDGAAFRLITSNGAKFTGNVTAATFTGDGAALLNLNGSAIATGTVADARLPAVMTAKELGGVTVRGGAVGTNGYLALSGGDATHTGYLSWYKKDGTRVGFLGYADDTTKLINFQMENGYNFNFAGTPVVNGGSQMWHAGNFDPNTKANLSGATFSGNIGFAGTGNNFLSAGTGDNATYSAYNFALNGWYGLGMKNASDNAVNGVYNFRTGTWDTKGGFYKNGVTAVYQDGGTWNISVQGSAGYLGGRASGTIWDNSNGNYKKSAEGTDRIAFDNNGRTCIGGGSTGYLMTVFQSGVGDKLHVNNSGDIWMAWANNWMSSILNSKITTDGRAYPRLGDGRAVNFNWSGQGGQPTWLWGSSGDGSQQYVYNPSNFSVNYANSAGSAGNSNTVQGYNFDGNPIRIPLMQISDNVNETNYPIGTTVVAVCANNTNVPRRGPCNIYLHATDNRYFRFDTGSTVLPGGWRNMGCINSTMYYFQRTY